MTFNIDVGYRSDMQTIKFDRTVRNPMTGGGGGGGGSACLIGEIYATVMVERTKSSKNIVTHRLSQGGNENQSIILN